MIPLTPAPPNRFPLEIGDSSLPQDAEPIV